MVKLQQKRIASVLFHLSLTGNIKILTYFQKDLRSHTTYPIYRPEARGILRATSGSLALQKVIRCTKTRLRSVLTCGIKENDSRLHCYVRMLCISHCKCNINMIGFIVSIVSVHSLGRSAGLNLHKLQWVFYSMYM